MPRDKDQITPELFLSDLLHGRKSPSRFGVLLNQICIDADISQNKLGQVAREIYADLIDEGHIRPGENLGSMNQSVISLVFNGKQDATPAQVYIWIRALKTFPKFAQFCAEKNFDPDELITYLWNTTDYKSPEELADAHRFAKWFIRPSVPKFKQSGPKSVHTTDDKNTDIEFPACRKEPASDSLRKATFEVRRALEQA